MRSPRRRSRSLSSAVLLLLLLAALAAPAAATASAPNGAPLRAGREALVLTKERLDLMKEVMASKWLNRGPIQDLTQEEAVTSAAVAQGLELGVAAGSTRTLFAAEIAAAKEVQLGWGSHWLYFGAPAELVAPDLTQLRATLGGISERLVALLPQLVALGDEPLARPGMEAAAAKILKVPYLGRAGRAAIVEALLGIRARAAAL